MSDYSTYSYRVICTPRETVVREEQLMGAKHGWNPDSPLDVQGATYHRIFDATLPGTGDPIGLVETADGEVFSYEDLVGKWDPKDAPLDEVLLKDTTERLHTTKSDFFKRQLEGIDKSVYAKHYPAVLAREDAFVSKLMYVPAPSIWTRFKWFTYPLRAFLASWLIGRDVDAEED